jgi:prepilin-type processing-associated H-X9-DG protein
VIWFASQTKIQSITDGTSKVYLIGEKYLDQNNYTTGFSGSGDEECLYSGFDDDFIRLASSGGYVGVTVATGGGISSKASASPYMYPPQQDGPQWSSAISQKPSNTQDDAFATYRFGSAHADGFNMAFCDGSVHTILYNIDPPVHAMLSNRNDGQTIDASMYMQQ